MDGERGVRLGLQPALGGDAGRGGHSGGEQ
jgi:hypothetical protein